MYAHTDVRDEASPLRTASRLLAVAIDTNAARPERDTATKLAQRLVLKHLTLTGAWGRRNVR
jgi:hypothetical protein